VVATKFLPRTEEEIEKGINGRQHVLNSIDSSLQHLGIANAYAYQVAKMNALAEQRG
jgi:aryl-alcohol dehydrogenase-like predicted oxidoreductase